MNKKGFTIAELLGVITILGIILILSFPVITNSIKEGKEKSFDLLIENIIHGLRDYANENREILPINDGDYVVLTLGNIKSLGIVKNEIINPKTNKQLNEKIEFTIKKENKKYIYDLDERTFEERKGKLPSPTIELEGSLLQYYDIGEEYVEKGYKAYDYNGKEISNVIVDSNINKEVSGVYLVKYTAVDLNKIGTIVYRTIIINNKTNFNNGDEVFIDITTGKNCTNYHIDNSITGFNGIVEGENKTKTTDNQTSCLKFYSFLDNKGETIRLILDHNISASVPWNSDNISTYGPSKEVNNVLDVLYNSTKDWVGTLKPQHYSISQTVNAKYNINYSIYKARLITAEEIAQIVGSSSIITGYGFNTLTTNRDDWFYFDGSGTNISGWKTQISGTCSGCTKTRSDYGWLFDRTSATCTSYGCYNNAVGTQTTNGYWTASAVFNRIDSAWRVYDYGTLMSDYVKDGRGVRPVIEVLKKSL